MRRSKWIAVIGPSPRSRGGVAGVIAQIERIELPVDDLRLVRVTSFRGGNAVAKTLSWIGGLARLAALSVPQRPSLAYVHIASRASTFRKTSVIALVRALRVPVLLHIHPASFFEQLEQRGPTGAAARWCLRSATAVVVLADVFAEPVRALHPSTPVHIVPNAPDVDEAALVRATARVPDRVLCVGAFVGDKGVDVLVEAMGLIAADVPTLRLALAGAGVDETMLRKRVTALGLDGRVEFLGWLRGAALEAEYAHASLFALPSRTEGFPLALLEAMWYGLPSIATAVGAVPELLEGGAGVLVPPEDPRALAGALRSLVQDPAAAAAMGESAARRVRASYTPSRQRQAIHDLLVSYAGTTSADRAPESGPAEEAQV